MINGKKIKNYKEIIGPTAEDNMTFEELTNDLTAGIYVEELKELITQFIIQNKNAGKTVSETIDEFFSKNFNKKLESLTADEPSNMPLTYKAFKEIMNEIKDETIRKCIINHINQNELKGISIEQTFDECQLMKEKLASIKIGEICCKCGVKLKKVFIDSITKGSYCENCSKGKIIGMVVTRNN